MTPSVVRIDNILKNQYFSVVLEDVSPPRTRRKIRIRFISSQRSFRGGSRYDNHSFANIDNYFIGYVVLCYYPQGYV